ncbi:anti-sigma factor [Actinomadura fibrosa]|uniref:anti-sigma factor n=1 Tax=Actinomadura fibrosa TaxID=111802 RepID=UPI0010415A3D|nr:anti-sigma factor [Actinomadura fibrosa]
MIRLIGRSEIDAAACLVAAVALGAAAQRADHRADRLQAAQDRVNAVLTAPDARTVTAPVKTGGQGTVVVSRRQDRAVVLLSSGLRRPPPSRAYELWLMGEDGARPAGMVRRTSKPMVLDGVGRSSRVGLTVEPAAGSPRPTTQPIMLAALPRT